MIRSRRTYSLLRDPLPLVGPLLVNTIEDFVQNGLDYRSKIGTSHWNCHVVPPLRNVNASDPRMGRVLDQKNGEGIPPFVIWPRNQADDSHLRLIACAHERVSVQTERSIPVDGTARDRRERSLIADSRSIQGPVGLDLVEGIRIIREVVSSDIRSHRSSDPAVAVSATAFDIGELNPLENTIPEVIVPRRNRDELTIPIYQDRSALIDRGVVARSDCGEDCRAHDTGRVERRPQPERSVLLHVRVLESASDFPVHFPEDGSTRVLTKRLRSFLFLDDNLGPTRCLLRHLLPHMILDGSELPFLSQRNLVMRVPHVRLVQVQGEFERNHLVHANTARVFSGLQRDRLIAGHLMSLNRLVTQPHPASYRIARVIRRQPDDVITRYLRKVRKNVLVH